MLRSTFNLKMFTLLLAVLCAWVLPSNAQSCGTPGTDGPGTISGVVNTYYPPSAATVTVSAGATSIALGAATAGGSTTPISAGDLLLVIQMQDATINTNNTTAYGANNGTGAGLLTTTAGVYEFVVATNAVAIGGGTVNLSSALVNTYSNAPYGSQGQKRFQVIRVPQYASITLGSVTALAWNGATGGVVAFDVAGTLNLGGGTINVSGKGFRGGGGIQYSGGTGTETDYRRPATQGWGGSKGEGVAGTPRYVYDGNITVTDTGVEGYVNGSFLRGAPGNAGGGANDSDPAGNSENAGGGGGANGGDGGHGGNTWSTNLAYGGLGGDAFTLASSSRVVMGGGGGAGSNNNTPGYRSSGAAGGGIVIVRAGAVSGAGAITATGADAPDPDNDGSGGGGAGGSVVFFTRSGTLSGLSINASGGRGGDNWVTQAQGGTPGNQHGPGGGGGGGVVYQSGGASVTTTGGAHGTTTSAATAYNSVDGSTGVSGAVTAVGFNGALQGAACVPVLTVTKTTTTSTVAPGGSASYKITVKNATGVAAATQVNISDTLPQPVTNGFTYTSTTTVTLSGGATRPSTTNPAANATIPSWTTFTIPAGGQVDITFAVKIASNVPTGTYQNPATATYLDPARSTSTGTTSAAYDPNSSTAEDVLVRSMLSGLVFQDADHDGIQESGEDWSGGTSVFVNLVQAGAVVQSVNVTAGTGTYAFGSAAAGSYTIVLTTSATSVTPTAPAGWIATMPTPQSYTVTLNTTNPILNLNFGLFNGTKVSGTVFQDDGKSSGTANNGVLDGGEIGLTGVAVKATDTGSTTYDQATTDATGKYTLWIPAAAASVRIIETNGVGYISTGASVGNSGGTYNRATDTISFTNTGLVYTGLNFGEIVNSTLSPNGSLQTLPNTSVFYAHTFVATTAGQVTFSTSDVASPNIRGYSTVLYQDTNCDGNLDVGEPQITAAVSVNAGATVCVLVKSYVPGSAPFDATDSITLTAQIVLTNASPALSLSYTATDITTVGAPKNSGLRLEKAVDKATATPGTVITYTITYINDSSGALSNIIINDATPAYTTFQSASCGTVPTGVTGCAVSTQPAVGASGTIQWTLTGSMTSAQTGTVVFSVKVN